MVIRHKSSGIIRELFKGAASAMRAPAAARCQPSLGLLRCDVLRKYRIEELPNQVQVNICLPADAETAIQKAYV